MSLLWLALALAAEGDGPLVTLTLSDGQQIEARVLARNERTIIIELRDGQRIELPASAVDTLGSAPNAAPATGAWGGDPNRSRYFYGPSAYSLGAGRGYLAQRALAITSVGVGVTDFWDLEAGAILPLLLTEAPVAVVSTKLSARAGERARAGVGTQVFLTPEGSLGFVFANGTYGNEDRHATVAAGVLASFDTGEIGADIVTTSVNWRLGEKTSVIGEVWWTYWPEGGIWPDTHFFIVPAGGARLFGPKFAVDLGLVPIFTGEPYVPVVPVPWVSFAWNWSLKKS
ncbi:MAG: hypothetical protein FJ102_13845 [Deltaproteobacteria bacterium]|nr:hypothetical protein [Deltaproteobacteria bacterium]